MSVLRRLFTRGRDQQIDRELQFHIDEQIAQHIASGRSPAEAARLTRLEFGGRQQIREDVRAATRSVWLDDFRGDVRFALRTYRRTPAFAALAVVTLALGIGVNTALFSVVREVLVKTLPVPNPYELVQIDCGSGPGATGGSRTCLQSYPAFQMLTDRHEGLTGIAAVAPTPGGVVAVIDGRREVITAMLASGNLFDVLGISAAAGRVLAASDERPGSPSVAVLSHAYWRRAFAGRPEVIGESFVLGSRDVLIAGVLPRDFRGLAFGESYDVFLPLTDAELFYPPGILTAGNRGWLIFIGRLQPGVSTERAAERLTPVFRAASEAAIAAVPAGMRQKLGLNAENIRVDVRVASTGATSGVRRSLQPTLRVLMIATALVLLIACSNLAGLFLARALNRQKELGLRFALGAGRFRLMRQLFTEILLIALAGGVLALLLAQWLAPAGYYLALGDGALDGVDLRPDAWMLGFTALVAIGAALLSGFAPVLRASATNPQDALRNISAHGSPRLTRSLMAAQVALTITIVGSAALFLQTLTNFRRIDVGFGSDRLLTVTMDIGTRDLDETRFHSFLAQGREALSALPGVQAVTDSYGSLGVGVGTYFNIAPPASDRTPDPRRDSAGVAYGGPGFVRTVGMTLLAGRDFDETDQTGSQRVAIVNESFARHFFNAADVVGRTVSFAPTELNQPFHIIGVVRDVRDGGLKRATDNMIYAPRSQGDVRGTTFVLRTAGDPELLAAAARRTVEQLHPNVGVLRMRTVQEQLENGLRRERLLATLGTTFSALALLLVAVGFYGMLNAAVARRTSEIGVRMALGASRVRIGWMLARETSLVLAVGVIAGAAGHSIVARLVRAELFDVMPTDIASVVTAIGLLIAVAVVAVGLPAWRATRIQPTEALRQDYA